MQPRSSAPRRRRLVANDGSEMVHGAAADGDLGGDQDAGGGGRALVDLAQAAADQLGRDAVDGDADAGQHRLGHLLDEAAVEAGHGQVLADAEAERLGRVHHHRGHHVAAGDDGGRAALAAEQPEHLAVDRLQAVAEDDGPLGDPDPVVGQALAEPFQALDVPVVPGVVADVGERLVAAVHQVVDGRDGRGHAVGVDPGLGQMGGGAAEHGEGDARLLEVAGPGVVDPRPGQDEPVHPADGHQLAEHLQLVVLLGEHEHMVATVRGRPDKGLDEPEDEDVLGGQLLARHVVAELHGPLRPEAAGGPVGLVVELLDGRLDAVAGLLGVARPVVEHVRDRLARDPGEPGHVVDVAAGLAPRRPGPVLVVLTGHVDLRDHGA